MLVFSATSAREGILYCLHLWLAPKIFGLLHLCLVSSRAWIDVCIKGPTEHIHEGY